jgi:hypothetical protein
VHRTKSPGEFPGRAAVVDKLFGGTNRWKNMVVKRVADDEFVQHPRKRPSSSRRGASALRKARSSSSRTG